MYSNMNSKLNALLTTLEDNYDILIGDLADRDEEDSYVNTYELNEKGSISRMCIRKNDLCDFTFLAYFPDLTELSIIESKNLTIESLTTFRQLKTLHISICPNVNLTGLEKFEHLESLSLTMCELDHIPSLKKLKNIKRLDVSGNKITSLSFLEEIENLYYLDLSQNNISCISGLAANIKITELDLSGNKIENFEPLCKLSALTNFQMLSNRMIIPNLDWLKNLQKLEVIELAHNKISSVLGLRELTNLKRLSIQNNFIGDIDQLNQELNEMHWVKKYVYGNIDKWDGIGYFEYMKSYYVPWEL